MTTSSRRVASSLRRQARALLVLADALEAEPAPAAAPVDEVAQARADRLLKAKGLWRETGKR